MVATYFVTFRLADSIPQEQLQALKRWRALWEIENPPPRCEALWQKFASEITKRTERYLDKGYGECVFADQNLADQMSRSLLHFQNQRHFTSSFTVMPNHVHLTIQPLEGFELEDILESIKGYVARDVNRRLNRTGKLFEQESYDRIVRDERHLFHCLQYIGNNADDAGIPRERTVRWIDPEWESIGWGFRKK
jgi:REP element-mobilizing transposase RayT